MSILWLLSTNMISNKYFIDVSFLESCLLSKLGINPLSPSKMQKSNIRTQKASFNIICNLVNTTF